MVLGGARAPAGPPLSPPLSTEASVHIGSTTHAWAGSEPCRVTLAQARVKTHFDRPERVYDHAFCSVASPHGRVYDYVTCQVTTVGRLVVSAG
jgi:hypothetical protein